MVQKIRTQYFGDKAVDRETLYEYTVLISDGAFNYGVDWSARKHGSQSSGRTYYYR